VLAPIATRTDLVFSVFIGEHTLHGSFNDPDASPNAGEYMELPAGTATLDTSVAMLNLLCWRSAALFWLGRALPSGAVKSHRVAHHTA
jgi:hypothetical protein